MGGGPKGDKPYEKIEIPPVGGSQGESGAPPPGSTPGPGTIPKPPAPQQMEKTCPAPGVFGAVDLSRRCDQRFLDTVKYLGVKTIIRYYDYPGSPTLPEKIPTDAEIALIKKNGFKLCAVFQHNNSKLASFTKERGSKDAAQALQFASHWKQPRNSAIYFGVDFDPSVKELEAVSEYAEKFSGIVRNAGYRVGAYGSGLTLETLLNEGHIDLSWLSMSTGFRKSKEFDAARKWNLKQTLNRKCGGIDCDFDYVNSSKPDFGQWSIP